MRPFPPLDPPELLPDDALEEPRDEASPGEAPDVEPPVTPAEVEGA
jgi:hypothetical protein